MRRFAILQRPFLDVWRGLERGLDGPKQGGLRRLALVFAGLALGWWIYVPLHELLHVGGCVAAGGEVSRLEIDPLYGGALLARIFPFVEAGGEYAGRLSGFDTRGSDLVYLATDLAPFLLTLLPGVWLLRRATGSGRPLLFGFALPFALAPLLSLTGDAYEIGSILVTRLPAWSAPAAAAALRGDDLLLKIGELSGASLWIGGLLAALTGAAWAFATYTLGDAVARLLGEGPVEPPDSR